MEGDVLMGAGGAGVFFAGGDDFLMGAGAAFFGVAFLGAEADLAGADLAAGLGGCLAGDADFPLFFGVEGDDDFAAAGFFAFEVMGCLGLCLYKS